MAVVLLEGFDHLAAGQLPAKGWTNNAQSMQAGRLGGQCARETAATVNQKILPSTYSTLFVGVAARWSSPALTGNWLTLFTAAAGVVMTLGQNGTGNILVKNSGGTTIGTGTTVLVTNTWYYIEFELVINGASGSIELHLNGVSGEIPLTTGNFGSTNVGTFRIAGNGTLATHLSDYDDIYVLDTTGSAPGNTFLGDTRVQTLFPNADGTYSQWSPTPSGAHFSNIDETTPDDDTTYNSDANPGDIDTYLTAGILASASVPAVQVNLYARKDDAGARQIAPLIRQAGTDYPGNTATLSANYLFYSQMYALDPSGASWTANNVNADEYGVKVIA